MLLCCAIDLVLLGPCFVRRHCRLLICRDLGKVLGEICFNDLEEGDDATRRTISRLMRRICRVIIVQNLQSELDSGNSLLQLSLVSVERRLLLSAKPVHLCLSLGQLRELVFQCGNLLLQLRRLGGRAVNPGADLLDFVSFLRLFCVRLFQLLVAVGLLGGICDKELKESNAKKSEKTDEIEKISTRIDHAAAESAQLKEEVATLENQLSKLAKAQAEMDRLRGEQKTAFDADKAELEKGITGVKLALKILNDYYAADAAHETADGAASGIISLLEVIEADFTKNLAQITADEEAAVAAYESGTKENEIDRTAKEQSVKYKIQ